MLKPVLSVILLCSVGFAFAQQAHPDAARGTVTFVKDPQRLPNDGWQTTLRQAPAWRSFVAQHPRWSVEFNEENRKPHRAFGPPIATTGTTPGERAMSFVQTLAAFGLPMDELTVRSVNTTAKHHYVHIAQKHEGMEVLFSKAIVKLDLQGNVIMFGLDVHAGISVSATPALSPAQVLVGATAGLNDVGPTEVAEALSILPIPVYRGVEHHVVYTVTVNTRGSIPGRWTCLVDANNGELLYRQNMVVTEDLSDGNDDAGADVAVSAQINHLAMDPAVEESLRNLRITIGGNQFFTDANGFIGSGVPGPVNFTAPLAGLWSEVKTNNVVPSISGQFQEGANLLSFDAEATIQERSAYFHVNNIHDHCVDVLPSFTGMDFMLETNVDLTNDNCNAFYDGSSINFYAQANDCYSLARINDVVYHEYGHGINDNFYDDGGSNFINGSIGEGYADVWAFSLTLNPILAPGYKMSDVNSFIRRYDANPKVFPMDLTGEVHANGEIIAGAWWDTYLLLGNDMTLTMDLFALAYPGFQAETANGNEGTAFREVLLDVLQADDDDADLTNGTPNGLAIVEGFWIHGITLVSGFDLEHTPLLEANEDQGIDILASAVVNFPYNAYLQGMQLNYQVNTGAWAQVLMTSIGNDDYQGTIPAQPQGTVIGYYIGLLDINNAISSVVPAGASETPYPNIPYFILVGYDLQLTEDADNENQMGDWQTGMPGDNATTGQWELNLPVGSFGTPGDPSTICQTDEQHTPGGEMCFLTGNAPSENDALGTNDVDDGRTTLQGDPIDLSDYENPTFTFYRWYTNNPPSGANPGADWWQVQITNDGNTWHPVENTLTGDRSWRRFAFRVADVVTPNSTVTLRFIASDSTHIGQNLDGGSLIEAAVDDIQLWDNEGTDGITEESMAITAVWPDPVSDELSFNTRQSLSRNARIEVIDPAGRVVMSNNVGQQFTGKQGRVNVRSLKAGSYVLRLIDQEMSVQARFTVVR